MNNIDILKKSINDSIEVKNTILNDTNFLNNIVSLAELISNRLSNGGKLIMAGNGGSASDAMHIVAELVGRFQIERKPYNAICLNSNISSITAISNDYSYDSIFSRQLMGIGKKGDVFIGISTSGNSKNIIEAFKKAKELNIFCVCLTGFNGGKSTELCDLSILVPSSVTARIQECHILIGHILCDLVERIIEKYE